MKRRTLILILVCMVLLTGCGASTSDVMNSAIDSAESSIADAVNSLDLEDDETEIDDETLTEDETLADGEIPDPDDLTMAELYTMSYDDIEAMLDEYEPDYRDVYGIDDDTVLDDSDWEQIRSFIGYQLWGSDYIVYERDAIEESNSTEISETSEDEISTENLINPTYDYINNMSIDEYRNYLKQLYEFSGGSSDSVEEMDDDELEEIKAQQLEQISDDDTTGTTSDTQ